MRDKDIAIVGIGCRFPGESDGADALWRMLMEGTDTVTEISPDRWSIEQFYHPQRGMTGKSATKWAGQISDIDRFDCHFFGISPREASLMDPQQRMLLEVCWEALEDAGQIPQQWRDARVGVYVGGFTLDYMLLQLGNMDLRGVEPHTATGSMMTLLANRLSYVYGFRGPSMTIDTACSSSLVAIHQACRSLQAGECNMAIAGGVNALLTPSYTVAESRAGMLSPTGRSRAFDASADGYTRGEGAGLVVLKTVARARSDEDRIYALIRATATNHDGQSEGLTVPSGEAQMTLMREALQYADIAPAQISYAEAHGTGTPVGDPIEARAIGSVLREGRDNTSRCLLGSIKTNIGHTEAAAGVAGLIKAALVMYHRQVPPHLHVREVNPAISLTDLLLEIPNEAKQLPEQGELFSCVNSFGFGGANAHAILSTTDIGTKGTQGTSREAGNDVVESTRRWLLPISAGDESSLRSMAIDMADYLTSSREEVLLADVCYSAAMRRQHLAWRACAHGRNAQEISEALRTVGEGAPDGKGAASVAHTRPDERGAPNIVFVYSGMGPQWPGMGAMLYREDPVFSQAMNEVFELFEKQGVPLRERWIMSNDPGVMDETEVAQPANFVIQVAITKWLAHHGVRPDVCIGHSAGEPAAAWAAGVFSLEDAVRISWARSHLQQRTSGQGGMLAIGMGEAQALAELQSLNESSVSLAAINSPQAVTLAGNVQALDSLRERLELDGTFARMLRVKVPYHSSYMDPLRKPLLDELAGIAPRRASIPLFSTVTGSRVEGPELDAEYWWKNVRQSVRFEQAVRRIMNEFPVEGDWVEIAPHPVLAQSIRETAADEEVAEVRCRASLNRKHPEDESLGRLLASLYVNGHNLDWASMNPSGELVSLPKRHWHDTRLWYELPQVHRNRTNDPESPLLAKRVNVLQPTWEMDLLAPRLSWLEDHRVGGAQVLPGAVYVGAALCAARNLYGGTDVVSVADVKFEKAMYWSTNERRTLHISIDQGSHCFEVASRVLDDDNARWERHCSGRLQFSRGTTSGIESLSSIKERCIRKEDGATCYDRLRRIGLEYGPCFQGIKSVTYGDGEALSMLVIPVPSDALLDDYVFHPVLLDLCLQTIAASIPLSEDESSIYMPVGIGRIHLYAKPSTATLWAHAMIDCHTGQADTGELEANVALYREDGTVVGVIQGCRVVAINSSDSSQHTAPQKLYQMQWNKCLLSQDSEDGDGVQGMEPGLWLLYGNAPGLGKSMCEQFAIQGHSAKFVVCDENSMVRDVLTRQMDEVGEELRGVIYLQAVNAAEGSIEGLRETSLWALHLMQAIADHKAHGSSVGNARLWIVTRSSQQVGAFPVLRPSGGSLWGLGRVFGNVEHAFRWGGLIDLEETASDVVDARRVVDECLSGSTGEEVSWRAGERHISRLVATDDFIHSLSEPVLRPDATYLITGGLGGLGLTSATWLACRGARHLLLLGRTVLPDREKWQSPDLPNAQRRRVKAVLALEAMGVSVQVEGIDISDHAALVSLLERHRREARPSIRGVIHSAGTTDDHLLEEIDDEQFYGVFGSKVIGAWNLHDALKNESLDFFVAYSSATSILPSSGQGNYASANACLDALIAWRNGRGLPALAIGWGPWRDAGLVRNLDLSSFFARRGLLPLSNEQGMAALAELLKYPSAHVLVLGARWQTFAQTSPMSRPAPFFRDLVEAEKNEAGQHEERLHDSLSLRQRLEAEPDVEARHTLLSEGLRDLVSEVMGLGRDLLSIEDSFTSRGMDSMMAIEIRNRVEYELGLQVAVVELLKGASAVSLAESIAPDVFHSGSVDGELDDFVQELQDMDEEQLKALLDE